MLRTVQIGRALAALAVASYHLTGLLATPRYLGTEIFSALTWRGDLGVDFFFVLSGFIILHAHAADIGRPDRLGSYLMKRVVRVYPIYWFYTGALTALIVAGFATVAHGPRTGFGWLSAITLIHFDNSSAPNPVAWTLFHEIVFYALFATLVLSRRFGLVVFAAWTAVMLVSADYTPYDSENAWATVLSAYNLDFIAGMLAYILAMRRPRAAMWAMIPALAVLATTYVLEARGLRMALTAPAYGLGFALLLAAVVAWERSGAALRLPLRPLEALGDASYSIYLTHEPLEGAFAKLMIKSGAATILPAPAIWLVVFTGAVTTGLLAYRMVEKPMVAFLRRHCSSL